jgi:hypothetical protein
MPPPVRELAHAMNPLAADLSGEHRAEPVPPEPDGLMANVDPALEQEVFDVLEREWVSTCRSDSRSRPTSRREKAIAT